MPTVVCPKCKKEYEVQLKVLGKSVRCKACGSSFKAKVLRAQMRKPGKRNPMKILLPIMGGGLFIIVALILSLGGDKKTTRKEGDLGPPPDEGAAKQVESVTETPAIVRTEREEFCLRFLEAVADNKVEILLGMFNVPYYHRVHRGEGEPHWSDLDAVEQMLKKQEYLNRLTDDTAKGGGFVRSSEVVHTKELQWDGEDGQVEVGFKNRHNGREQERTFMVQLFGGKLLVYDFIVGPEHGGDLAMTEDRPRTLDEKYKRRISPEGEIQEAAFTPDTDETTQAELKMLMEDMEGDNRRTARQSRERLIDLGKKAIPPLLNGLVGLDMKKEDDIAQANKYISVLRVITGESFRFAPGLLHQTVLESEAEDLRRSIRLWFGWWNRNKDTWTGRDFEKEMEDW